MDPQARRATWEIVRQLKANGVTILLTTHFMEEAEQLADRVAIIDRGRLVALDAPTALGHAGGPPAELRFRAASGLPLDDLRVRLGLSAAREIRPGEYVLDGDVTPRTVSLLAAWLAERDVLLADLRVGQQSLEDVYLRLTGSPGAESAALGNGTSEPVEAGTPGGAHG
jgi:ABC-2 type transport system ATP-binding protein